MAALNDMDALLKELTGQRDSRGIFGIMSRGRNVNNSTSYAAHRGGGPQFGRPKKQQTTKGNYTEDSLKKAMKRRVNVNGY